jgi:hypothetical protein
LEGGSGIPTSGTLDLGTTSAPLDAVKMQVATAGLTNPTFRHDNNGTSFYGAGAASNGSYFRIEPSNSNITYLRASTLTIEPSNGLNLRANTLNMYASDGIGHGTFSVNINGAPSMYVVGSNSDRKTLFSDGVTATPGAQVEIRAGNGVAPALLVKGNVSQSVDIFDVTDSVGNSNLKVTSTGDVEVSTSLKVENTSTPGENLFEVIGSAGSLFAISDTLDGDIFAVNDVSGLPILTVNSNETVTVDGLLNIKTYRGTSIQTNTVVRRIHQSVASAVFFKYHINDGTNARAGTIMVNTLGSSITFTDTPTADIGSTASFTWSATMVSNEITLTAQISAGTWNIKVNAEIM